MRNIPFKILLFIASFAFAQENTISEELILGKWKVAKVEIDNVITAEKGKTPDLADTTATKSQAFINDMAKNISEAYLNSKVCFNKNKKIRIKAKRKRIKGTYTVNKEDGYIMTDIENFKKLHVYKLEKDTLIINQVDDNDLIRITLIRK